MNLYDLSQQSKKKKPKLISEGAPIATTPGSVEPGGAVDNFKQQMANNTEVAYQKKQQGMTEGDTVVKHRIGLTVTDPNHPMVSKRNEPFQRTVRVPGDDPAKAINAAIAHYRRKGYKVHDHHYMGTVDYTVNEFAIDGGGEGGGNNGHWYTDGEIGDRVGDAWFEEFDVSHDMFDIDARGEKAKRALVNYANQWFDNKGYNVNVVGAENNEEDHDLKWYIVGSLDEPQVDEAAPDWLRHTAGAATGALAGVGASFPGAAIAGPIGGAVAGAYGAKAGYDLGAGAADWVYDKVTGKRVPADKAAVDEELTMKHQRDHTTQRRPDISNSLADRDFDMSEKPNVAKSADGHPTVKWRHHGHAGHTRVEPTLKPTTVQRKDTRPIPSFLKKGMSEDIGDLGYNVVRYYEKTQEVKKLTNWLEKEAGLPRNSPLYFDDVDLVYGNKTIVPGALINPKLTFNDLLTAVVQASKQGMAEATGDEKFDTMMGQIQREPKYPDSQMPPTDVKDLYDWAVENNKLYHEIFAEWANREGYKSVAPALQRAGDLDTEALDYWTPRVWKIYWGEVRGIDSEMPPEWAKKRVPDELRDYLETVFDAYNRIVFDWPTEYRQIGQQGVAEGGKKKKKKSSRSMGGYFFPGYAYTGGSNSGEGGGDSGGESKNPGMAEGTGQQLNIQQLATVSDEALDNAYHYGRSTPGNSFGWQANLKSAAYAKHMIDKGVTDIEAISDAIHKGWNVTAQAFVQNPAQFSDTEKLKAAGKLEAKLQQRAELMKQNYAQLSEEEKEKDRVVARALLQAVRGQQGVSEGGYRQGFADPNAPTLGGGRRKDDEGNSEFDDRQRRQTGMIFYNVDDVETAQQLGLKQTRTGKWYLRTGNRHAQQTADRAFGLGRIWYPESVEEAGVFGFMSNEPEKPAVKKPKFTLSQIRDMSKQQDEKTARYVRSNDLPKNPNHMRVVHDDVELVELSNELLGRYKKELGVRASAADRAGNFDKGHEYFKKINRATVRQGDNDARRHAEKENDIMETRLNMMRKAGYDL